MPDKEIPLIPACKTKRKDVTLDTQGFFVIEVHHQKNRIHVEYYHNVYKNKRIVSGTLKKIFVGTQADALSDTIAQHVPTLRPEHYLYLGRELQKAQKALENNTSYEQGGC